MPSEPPTIAAWSAWLKLVNKIMLSWLSRDPLAVRGRQGPHQNAAVGSKRDVRWHVEGPRLLTLDPELMVTKGFEGQTGRAHESDGADSAGGRAVCCQHFQASDVWAAAFHT